jgi:hypothetical protein
MARFGALRTRLRHGSQSTATHFQSVQSSEHQRPDPIQALLMSWRTKLRNDLILCINSSRWEAWRTTGRL